MSIKQINNNMSKGVSIIIGKNQKIDGIILHAVKLLSYFLYIDNNSLLNKSEVIYIIYLYNKA